MADYDIKGRLSLEAGQFIAATQQASSSLGRLDASAQGAGSSMNKWVTRGAIAATAALGGLAMAGLKAVSNYQQASIAFTTMLGSAEKATSFLKEMRDFAAATPFELPQLLTGAQRLLAVGFAAEEIKPMLTAVGDAASGLGLGGEGIDRMTLALQQMQSMGRITGQDLKQLSSAGVPALQYLASAAGVTTGEMQKMIEKGAIPAKEGIAVLTAGMEGAIVGVKGFGGMMEKQSQSISGLFSTLKDTVRNAFVDGMQKYVPMISKVFADLLPKVEPVMNGIVKVLALVITNVGKFVGALVTMLSPVINGFIIPAFKLAAGAILLFIKGLGFAADLIKNYSGVFKVLGSILGLAALGFAAVTAAIYAKAVAMKVVRIATMAYEVAQLLMNSGTLAQVASTNILAASMLRLNAVLMANPIALIVGAVALLIAGFVLLWQHSDAFRKIVIIVAKGVISYIAFMIRAWGGLIEIILKVITGPMRLFLGVLQHLPGIGKYAKQGLDMINNGIEGVGNFADTVASKVEGFGATLDKLNKKTVKPKIETTVTTKKTEDTKANDAAAKLKAALTGGNSAAGAKAADTATKAKEALRSVLQGYNDFIKNEFISGFTKDSQTARDTIIKGLDEVRKVFDEKAKSLKGAPLKNLESVYTSLDESVRAFIPQAEATAKAIEAINGQIDDATKALEQATANRKDAADAFGALLRKPFGEPSEIDKALKGAGVTVDNIISMYDNLVTNINKRYDQIDPSGKERLISFLTDETAKLISIAKDREKAVKKLEDAQKALDDVMQKQADFKSKTTSSIKDFATALADISKADSNTTISVIKTASGMVVTQMGTASKGINTITDQLKDRLKSVTDFANNINILLSRGLSKEYIQQLISAGPEAAGATAALLATAGQDQISTINDMYTQINSIAASFGDQMSATFFDDSVKMAKGLVDGLTSQIATMDAKAAEITAGITTAMTPLASLGTNLGNDLAQGLLDALNAKKAALVALATSIAAAIAAAMADALAAIGVADAARLQAEKDKAAADAAAAKAKADADAAAKLKDSTKVTDTYTATRQMLEDAMKAGVVTPPSPGKSMSPEALAAQAYAKSFSRKEITVEKGAVTVSMSGSNATAADVGDAVNRAMINALNARGGK